MNVNLMKAVCVYCVTMLCDICGKLKSYLQSTVHGNKNANVFCVMVKAYEQSKASYHTHNIDMVIKSLYI